jgi:heme O synthase-like polyprenyltransferase
VTTPVVLLCSIAETLTRLPQPAANIPAALLFAAASAFYVGVETVWFARESKRGLLVGFLWGTAVLAMSALTLAATALLFAGL